jgi:hypothetical protein
VGVVRRGEAARFLAAFRGGAFFWVPFRAEADVGRLFAERRRAGRAREAAIFGRRGLRFAMVLSFRTLTVLR